MKQLMELEHRLHALEQEVGSLRAQVACISAGGKSAAPCTSQTADVATVDEGEAGTAPGIVKLRDLLSANGVQPGNEIVRQEIAAMRDQEEDE